MAAELNGTGMQDAPSQGGMPGSGDQQPVQVGILACSLACVLLVHGVP
jgi:hypothetical protein